MAKETAKQRKQRLQDAKVERDTQQDILDIEEKRSKKADELKKKTDAHLSSLEEVKDLGAAIGKLMQEQGKSTDDVAGFTKSWLGVMKDIGKEANFTGKIDKKRFALAKSGLADLEDVYTNAQNVGSEYFQTFDFTKKINAARKLGLNDLADEYVIAQKINDANKRKHQIIETAGKQMLKPFEALDSVIRKLPMGDLLADVLGIKDKGEKAKKVFLGFIGKKMGIGVAGKPKDIGKEAGAPGKVMGKKGRMVTVGGKAWQRDFGKEAEEASDEGGEKIHGKMSGWLKKIPVKRILMVGFTAVLVAVAAIGKHLWGLVQSSMKMQKELGVGAGFAMDLDMATREAAVGGFLYGESLADVQARATALVTEWGVVNETTKRSVEVATDLERNYGIAAGSAAKLAELMSATSSSTKDVLMQDMGEEMKALQEEGIPVGEVMDEVAGNADFFASHMKDSGTNIIKAAMFAKKLGMNMNTITGAADSLLDFESSVNAEMEASMLLGRRINTDKARQLAFAGDMEGMQKEIMRQVGSEADFNRMNVFQRKALAKAFGLSVSDLATMVSAQEKLNNMSAEELADREANAAVTRRLQSLWGQITDKMRTLYDKYITPIGKTLLDWFGTTNDLTGEFKLSEGKLKEIDDAAASIGSAFESIKVVVKDWLKDFGRAEDGSFSISKAVEEIIDGLKTAWTWLKEHTGLIKVMVGLWALNKMGLMGFVTDGIKRLGQLILQFGKAQIAKRTLDAPSKKPKVPAAPAKKGGLGSMMGKMKPASIIQGAAAMVIMAAATWLMAKAMQQFSTGVSWKGVMMGIVSLGALTIAALLIGAAGPGVLIGAAAIVVLSAAMWVFAKAMQEMSKGLPGLEAFFAGISQIIGALAGGVVTIIDGLVGAFERLAPLGVSLLSAAAGMVAVSAALLGFGGGALLGGVAAGIGKLFGGDPIKKFERLAAVADPLTKTAEAIKSLGESTGAISKFKLPKKFVKSIEGIVPQPKFITSGWNIAKGVLGPVVKGAAGVISSGFEKAKNLAGGVASFIGDKWTEYGPVLKEKLSGALSGAKEALGQGWEVAKNLAGGVASWVGNKWDESKVRLSTFWENVKKGGASKWEDITKGAGEALNSVLLNMEGLKKNAVEKWNDLTTAASDAWKGIKGWFGGVFEDEEVTVTPEVADITTAPGVQQFKYDVAGQVKVSVDNSALETELRDMNKKLQESNENLLQVIAALSVDGAIAQANRTTKEELYQLGQS